MQQLEQEKTERFANTFLGWMNGAALSLMISIGHRTGLFDALEASGPVTSEELAAAAKLQERYVREWLGAVTAGGIVSHDPVTRTYALPPEHAHWLVRKSAKDNLAVLAQYIAVLGGVEDEVVKCFREGGGVPYSSFHRFHDVMAEDSGQSLVPVLMDQVIPLVPGLWEKLEQGIYVLDIGCGRGRALLAMAAAFPKSRFAGYDLSQEALDDARLEAARRGLSNLRFEMRDVSRMEEKNAYGLITAFDAIHDQAWPDRVLSNIHEALRPGGVFLMQDIDASRDVHRNLEHPIGPLLYAISCMHCMTVSLAQGGRGLGTMWGRETALEMLTEAGFRGIQVHKLHHDLQNCIFTSEK